MSYIYYPEARPATRNDRFPWLLFLFVSFALLVIFNWPLAIHSSVGEYNVAQEISVAGGSTLVRQLMLIALGLVAMVSLARRPADPLLRIDGPMGWLLIAFVAWSLMSVTVGSGSIVDAQEADEFHHNLCCCCRHRASPFLARNPVVDLLHHGAVSCHRIHGGTGVRNISAACVWLSLLRVYTTRTQRELNVVSFSFLE